MKSILSAFVLLLSRACADVTPATLDLMAIRDTATLETKVIQDWQPVAKVKGVKQKQIEITVCEWWPRQKVRMPVTFYAPDAGLPCSNIVDPAGREEVSVREDRGALPAAVGHRAVPASSEDHDCLITHLIRVLGNAK